MSFDVTTSPAPGPSPKATASDIDLLRASAFFDVEFYLATYSDVRATGADAVCHYLESGAAEGRDPSRLFSTAGYLSQYPDVDGGFNPLVHFLRSGLFEGRDPGTSDPTRRRAARSHRVSQEDIELIKASGFFDEEYYLEANPDVAAHGFDATLHFLNAGGQEGRDPSDKFSSYGYLKRHPDVEALGFNPLLHYLRGGKAEGRRISRGKLLRPQWSKVYDTKWDSISPIPTFSSQAVGPRLTVITDSVAPSSLFGGVGTALILGILLANRLGATLRLVTRTDPPDAQVLQTLLDANRLTLDGEFETAFVPQDGETALGITDADIFMTTSWWTTRATLCSIERDKIVYLLQEDERMFYPYGDTRLLCAETLGEPNLAVVVNTPALLKHLSEGADGYSHLARDGLAFQPAFPGAIQREARQDLPTGKKKFFFYSRPHNERNLFWRGGLALANAIEDGILPPDEWDFYWVGKDTPDVMLPHGVRPHRIQGLDWPGYQALVAQMDAALVLMSTPHPSYPPFDLAGAGVAVLTNTHPGKEDLSRYSRNILMSAPTLPGLLEGLSRVAELGRDGQRRRANVDADHIERSWVSAMDQTVTSLHERFRHVRAP